MDSTFLKWAGGKTWFVKNQKHRLPETYERYIDPFVGGGALYFYLEPERAIINDVNSELIATYRAIQQEWDKVEIKLREHARHHNRDYYYQIRNMKPRKAYSIAARMIYLNRTCFNGIYRVNKDGKFNVPIGSPHPVITNFDQFQERSKILQGTEINEGDFEPIIDQALPGDFLFCDPPYAVLEEDRFVSYTRNEFNWNDQIRLRNALVRALERDVQIIMTNVNHHEVKALYEGIDGFILDEVTRYSGISGTNDGRKPYSELIVSANIRRN